MIYQFFNEVSQLSIYFWRLAIFIQFTNKREVSIMKHPSRSLTRSAHKLSYSSQIIQTTPPSSISRIPSSIPLLKLQEDVFEKQQNKVFNRHFKTNSLIISWQQLKPHYQQKQQTKNHFNIGCVKLENLQLSKRPEKNKGKRFARAQNLKNIAKHIKCLIANNRHLTVKILSYILYQIMGQTKLGLQIVEQNYPFIDSQTISQLGTKYVNQKSADSSLRLVIRNVRRRLYDALNVMIAAQILQKSTHNYLKISIESLNPNQKNEEITNQEVQKQAKIMAYQKDIQKWNQMMRESKERVAKKRKVVEELNKRLSNMRKLINRNKTDLNQKQKPLFHLPIVIVKSVPRMLIQLQSDTLTLKSPKDIQILPDMQLLDVIFKAYSKNQKLNVEPNIIVEQ